MASNFSGYTEVLAWGSDNAGQMGLASKNTGKNYPKPRFCTFNVIIHSISCGEEHSAFIAKNGYIYTMGSNIDGRLGISSRSLKSSTSPCLVESLSKIQAVKISCGGAHTAALMETGEIFTWGNGSEGQLGIGTLSNHYSPQLVNFLDPHTNKPLKVFGIDIDCGNHHTGVITDKGELYMFGAGAAGQLGTGRPEKEILPYKLDLYNGVSSISCGYQHTLILTEHSKVYASGSNSMGQLGTGNHKTSYVFQKVPFSNPDITVKKITAGQHSAAVSEAGDLYVWGTSTFGEFLNPQRVNVEGNGLIADVSIGDGFGCALDIDGNAYSWGFNDNGELGIGNYEPRKRPTLVTTLDGVKVVTVACGGKFCMALGPTVMNKEQNLQGYRVENSYRNTQKRRPSNLSEDKHISDVNKSAVHLRRERGSEIPHDVYQKPNAGAKHRMSLYIDRPSDLEEERNKSMIQDVSYKDNAQKEGKQGAYVRTMLDMWKEGQRNPKEGNFEERNARRSHERPRDKSKENTRRGMHLEGEGNEAMREIKMFKEHKENREHKDHRDNRERNEPRQHQTKEKTPTRKENKHSQKGSLVKENEPRRREEENSIIESRIIPRGSTSGFQSIDKDVSMEDDARVDPREIRERPKKEKVREKSRERTRDDEGLRRENIMLKENMEDLKRRLREYEKRYNSDAGKQEKVLQRKYENLNRDFNVVENELKMEREAVDELKRGLDEERRHNSKYLKELEEQRTVTLNLEVELRKLYEKENSKLTELAEAEKEVEFLRRKNEELQKRLVENSQNFDKILEEKENQIRKFENKNNTTQQTLDKLEDKFKRTFGEERSQKELIERMEKERESQKLWIVDLQMKLSEAQAKADKANFNMKEHHENMTNVYGKQFSEKDEEIKHLHKQTSEFTQRMKDLEKENKELRELVEAMEEALQGKIEENQGLSQMLADNRDYTENGSNHILPTRHSSKISGARRSQDLMRSEDSMLIPKKEFEILKDQSLHREMRRVDFGVYTSEKKQKVAERPENITLSESKYRSEKLAEIDVNERSPADPFEYLYRKKRLEEEVSREIVEERYDLSKDIVNKREQASPLLKYISNNSSPEEELPQNRNEMDSFNESGHKNQTQNYEEDENQKLGSGEKEMERSDVELRIGESLEEQNDMDISGDMRTFGAMDYASQSKLQEQINRSAAKIMQLLNIQPSSDQEDKENGKKGAKMFGREPYKTAKFAGLELYQSEDAEKEEEAPEEDALKERAPWKQENNNISNKENQEILQIKINPSSSLHLTLGEKMKQVLKEGKENFGAGDDKTENSENSGNNLSDLRNKLQDLQKNKIALEQRMQDFEKKLKETKK